MQREIPEGAVPKVNPSTAEMRKRIDDQSQVPTLGDKGSAGLGEAHRVKRGERLGRRPVDSTFGASSWRGGVNLTKRPFSARVRLCMARTMRLHCRAWVSPADFPSQFNGCCWGAVLAPLLCLWGLPTEMAFDPLAGVMLSALTLHLTHLE